MSYDSSFTLCPSNGGAFASYSCSSGSRMIKRTCSVQPDSKQQKDEAGTNTSTSITSHDTKKINNLHTASTVKQRVIPGTLLQDWMLPSHNLRRLHHPSIRASPFEPLVHHRNLPKSGTISPLNVGGCQTGQPHRIPPASSSTAATDSPPVSEIRIPTPQTFQAAPGEDGDDISSETKEDEDYKTLYLCCQRDLHESQEHSAMVAEENRLLKRQLIQLQKQLYVSTRTKRSLATVSWSIPESRSKRRRPSAEASRS